MSAEEWVCPRYDALPLTAGAPPSSSWGMWGDVDPCGALNHITAERRRRAAGLVTQGIVVPLDLPIDFFDPPLFGRRPLARTVHRVGSDGAALDEEVEHWNLQASSQWDGFAHVKEPGIGMYNGLERPRLGVDRWLRHGIVTRAVLADVARARAERGCGEDPLERGEIRVAELENVLEAKNVSPAEGDVLLVRTGWLAGYRALTPAGRRAQASGVGNSLGLAAGEEMASMLWNLHVAAVAADNPSLEAWPPVLTAANERSLHRSLLVRLGIPIGELFDLDELADRCAQTGRYDFCFVSIPLNLPMGIASPANAIAIL